MRNRYNGKDLSDRLDSTVIRYRDIPVLCRVAGDILHLTDLETGNLLHNVEADDIYVDISSIQLGYVNYSQALIAVYLKRAPLRKYKQGVVPGDLAYKALTNNQFGRLNTAVFDIGFKQMCKDSYPTFEEAINMITKKSNKIWESVALSRDVAVFKADAQLQIFVKEECVGWYSLKTKETVLVKKEHPWLVRSILERVNIHITNEGL